MQEFHLLKNFNGPCELGGSGMTKIFRKENLNEDRLG
jgi:hypothetical protein